MNSKITIGQYYPAESLIHSLDPRVKLIGTIIFITSLFLANNFVSYLIAFMFLVFVLFLSKVPPKLVLRSLKSIFFIIIFTFILNILLTSGETILYKISFMTITKEGLLLATRLAIRLIMLVMGSSLLTLTTSPLKLTDAIEYILKPLKVIGVPAQEIAMMMTITLRFIPTLVEEMDKIMKAQIARGADLDTGGLIKKAKGLIPILVPLFLSSFRRAEDLAIAMESRCYRGDVNRTKMKQLKIEKIDFYAILILVLFFAITLATRFIF